MKSLLIYAPPGVGKTTLLRSLARQLASPVPGLRTVIVDTREELGAILQGERLTLDVLSGYPRHLGIEIAVRSLGAELILCDEIGSPEDARAILSVANCGVPLIATAHAATPEELLSRPPIRALHDAAIFASYVSLTRSENTFQYHFFPREGTRPADGGKA